MPTLRVRSKAMGGVTSKVMVLSFWTLPTSSVPL